MDGKRDGWIRGEGRENELTFLRERPQVEQLIRYIVEEAPEDAEKQRNFKFPFISCEIFTCEVDIILKTLVEDEELMNLLFSFLDSEHSHSALLAGYFSKVVICLLMRKTISLMNYIQAHQEIIRQLIDLIGITSIMEVLIRLIGADEHIYANYAEAMRWLEDSDVLEMIVDKFSSSDFPEVHANVAETLCAITRYAPPGISAKIASPRLIGRLFHNALEESRPKSVLFNSLSVCISLLDPKRLTFGTYHAYNRQFSQGPSTTANPETVEGMLESLGNLLKLLDVSSEEGVLLTTYGKLQPPLGKQRLKIIEFISVLLSSGNEAAEKEVIRLGAIKRILDMFFEYSYNNFLHHHVENIILSCFESKSSVLVEHLLHDCDLVGMIMEAEKNPILSSDSSKPTVGLDGSNPPRVGNIGHLTRISNKLVHLGNTNTEIQAFFQENTEWLDWCSNVLCKRNAVENVYQWVCGRPTALQDRTRDSDDDDYQDRDYDVAALANNLSQAFHYGIYSNDMEEVQASLERDEEDVYFDDESAEVVISSLRLGDDQDSGSLFTNSNWFAFEDDRVKNDRLTGSLASASPADDETGADSSSIDEVDGDNLNDTATSQVPEAESKALEPIAECAPPAGEEDAGRSATSEQNDWVEWRETSISSDISDEANEQGTVVDGVEKLDNKAAESSPSAPEPSPSIIDASERNGATEDLGVPQSTGEVGGAENIGSPPSSSSSSAPQDLPSGDEQVPKLDDNVKTDLVQEGN
ncbi:uncharacterized protein LOC104901230 isoform X2 [Beta vulgaris subsp. vulgaris]|uniref:uncharacterized protein LOC104901230 isoform X2 n=1 Tax=Beta vulgaris subsp. vulgaris TaxID=3555 RepID=UPI002036AA0A|nr:uncharacterized protein LOC104901230 isoform X2 [Beta vulgaris subsp. vulgaris]